MNPMLAEEWTALSSLIRLCHYFTYYTSVVYVIFWLKNFIHQHLMNSTHSSRWNQMFSLPQYFNNWGVVIKYQTHGNAAWLQNSHHSSTQRKEGRKSDLDIFQLILKYSQNEWNLRVEKMDFIKCVAWRRRRKEVTVF